MRALQPIRCIRCSAEAPRTGSFQKYCAPCSDAVHAERQRGWQLRDRTTREFGHVARTRRRSDVAEFGAALSVRNALGLGDIGTIRPRLLWQVRVCVPFDHAVSKNFAWSSGSDAMGLKKRAYREEIVRVVRQAVQGQRIVQSKLWLDIVVQKPSHVGDAVNVVDTVCDAVKVATGLDDRWFSLRLVDWQIVKTEPQLLIGIGQEVCVPEKACASCGRLMAFERFGKHTSRPDGLRSNCRECLNRTITAYDDAGPLFQKNGARAG